VSEWNYVSLNEALKIIRKNSRHLREREMVSIDLALGRRLATDIRAKYDLPMWNRSAVDGYALRSRECRKGTVLSVVGHISAGQFSTRNMRKGECIYVATGAPVPSGADAVIMKEFVESRGDEIRLLRSVSAHENISLRGSDVRKGQLLAAEGKEVSSGIIGAAASQGIAELEVYRKPRVAILPGGDEIAPVGTELSPGQIYDINSHVIASVALSSGAEVKSFEPLRDTPEAVNGALELTSSYDVLVFCSGSSVGERDYVAEAIRQNGRLLFHGVKIRPGRPCMFGVVRGKAVLGLPGYPVSSFVGAHYLLRTCLKCMQGLEMKQQFVKCRFRGKERADGEFDRVIPVSIRNGVCRSVFKESGAISSISMADGLLLLPGGKSIRENDSVTVEVL
jgi:molybdopterin molybdotransferase